jgi:hypothetical protein
MADINQVITLGIGTPASIKFFLTFGLGLVQSATVSVYTASINSNPSPTRSPNSNPSPAEEIDSG